MKRFYIIAILITICGMTAMAQNSKGMAHQSTGRDRDGITTFCELLQLQFNDEGMIEVIGCENDYYNVSITKDLSCVWNGIIGRGFGNIITYNDFSPAGTYMITLTSSRGSITVWKLENGVLNGSNMPNWGGISDQMNNDHHPLYDR